MTDLLLFLGAASLGLWVLLRGAPWDRVARRNRDATLDLTGHRWGRP